MKKLVMLTIFACCVTMSLVGCENGNINIDNLISEESGNACSSGEEEIKESRK